MKDIKPGAIIQGPNWPEPVEIKLVEETGPYIHIVGSTTVTGKHIDQLIPPDDFKKLKVSEIGPTFSEDPWKVFLAVEATRYRFASMYDPLLAMNTSKVDPLPHQIEAVYGYVLKLPRIRFLIADDPGAGKTIMAGLIIKELKLRHLVKRILIVSPGHLKDQWRRELSERFEEKFLVVDRGLLDALYGENVWDRENQIITSIDFTKREEVLPGILAARFDLIVVDEAHKMSAYRYGDKTQKTARYRLGEALSRITEHLLFLTATPHKGDPENFRLFLDLLEPGFFATNEMVMESIKNKDNPLFIRRVKEDLKSFDGEPLFLPRHIKTVSFNLGVDSPREKELYNELSEYVNTQYNKALTRDKKRNVAFALVILQRRLASSTYALWKSLERRKKRLQNLLEGAQDNHKFPDSVYDFEVVEDLSEEERWKEEEIWETLSVAENREELQREIITLDDLIEKAKEIIQAEEEIKLTELRKSLSNLTAKYPDKKDQKILIFTEAKDTLEYLERKIHSWGYHPNVIHGGMRLEDRIKAESVFKNESDVLIATEAAGEGINLQFCHLMINYDIPWNPNRLEQRMGRIHRYGQTKEVFIFNLVASDTREGKVLTRLFLKLEEIKKALGSDKVFDVLSEVLSGTSLSQLLMEAAANARGIDEILREIDIQVDDEYIEKVKENLGESLATRFIDHTRIKEMARQAREYKLIPEYTENFFKKAFLKAGGKLTERKDGFLSIDSIPFDIRKIAEDDLFKKTHGAMLRRYPKSTFDKDIAFKNPDAEFISFGHPLFEAVMGWIERNFKVAMLSGANFYDPDRTMDGYILFYEGEISDGTGEIAGKRLFSFFISKEGIKQIAPSILWDLSEGKIEDGNTTDVESLKEQVSTDTISELEKYRVELVRERSRQADIKKKYGVKSLEYLIVKLDGELIDLHARKDLGEKVDFPIRNKEQRKEGYEKALVDLKLQIEKETSLTMSSPRFLGIVRVRPSRESIEGMKSDPDIELVGMRVAIEYEARHGRKPKDVSAENLGFDIRSTEGGDVVRYIEVKARSKTGPVALTKNEWFKAQRFGEEYYLYVVTNAGTESPELYVIKNPASTLKPDQQIEVVRYLVSFADIKQKGEKASD